MKVESTDERVITLDFPVGGGELHYLAETIKEAAEQGYALEGGAAIMGGHQRDPYPTGLKIVLRRKP